MTLEEIALWSLILDGAIFPLVGAAVVFLWRLDRRVYRVEWQLGIDPATQPPPRRFLRAVRR